ncbi:O-antigen/teichoic acid export membrane protein [Micromonospora violae]|uniref:O-antigen/teichoic acid export membrane protein n=1 Tax=Micromonospora violae TaxID=1278207 RepID=A0A4Q7UDF4_9ACTN|nr:hypothetical protein [Micromonospora violae]RZT77489.1 O-antigen/teichoic acid export membrane protein [Micromonospora violae]
MKERSTSEQTLAEPTEPLRSPGSRRPGVRSTTVVASVSSLVSGLLNAGILAYSARQGQTAEIAAYSVMTAALTWVANLIMGGSSLLYVSGNDEERRAAHSQRLLVAVPAMATATLLIAAFYIHAEYGLVALLSAGGVMIFNSLADLRFGDLARQMRFVAASAAIVSTRLLSMVLLLAGLPLTTALLVGAATYLLSTEVLACHGPAAAPAMWRGLSLRAAGRAFGMSRRLYTYSLAEAFTGRASTIALSLVASPHVVGCYGALVNIYQALVAVTFSGLRVPMALRTRRRHNLGPRQAINRDSEMIAVVGATIIAAGVIATAPWLTSSLLSLPIPESALWLQLLALALPFTTMNRAVALNRIGDGKYVAASRLGLSIAVLVGGALLIQAATLGPTGAAAATPVAEMLVAAALLLATVTRRHRRRGSHRPRPVASDQKRQPASSGDLVGR